MPKKKKLVKKKKKKLIKKKKKKKKKQTTSSSSFGGSPSSSFGSSSSSSFDSSSSSSFGGSSSSMAPSSHDAPITTPKVPQGATVLVVPGDRTYSAYMQDVEASSNKLRYHHLQVQHRNHEEFWAVFNYGRIGTNGQTTATKGTREQCLALFLKKLKEKSKKYTVLQRGESASLGPMEALTLQDRWKWRPGARQYLDASVLFFGHGGEYLGNDGGPCGNLDYQHTTRFNVEEGKYAATHSGDQMTHDSGQHIVQLHLEKLPEKIGSCCVALSAYSAAKMSDMRDVDVRVKDAATGKPLCGYELTDTSENLSKAKAVIMCNIHRGGPKEEWKVKALGQLLPEGNITNYGPIVDACKRACQ